jgi:hypothetical protein
VSQGKDSEAKFREWRGPASSENGGQQDTNHCTRSLQPSSGNRMETGLTPETGKKKLRRARRVQAPDGPDERKRVAGYFFHRSGTSVGTLTCALGSAHGKAASRRRSPKAALLPCLAGCAAAGLVMPCRFVRTGSARRIGPQKRTRRAKAGPESGTSCRRFGWKPGQPSEVK